ncbi:hypothetical protein CDAR_274171 [Caerostris darwini]|uniref:Uncharacterized protein n=1 Tax=Caerostris darwini TaxID=1538125 RepID=A0AAV4RBC7_9ARAC|nr:hypothetical protein CDAR_274171 [Caerostris darwini]
MSAGFWPVEIWNQSSEVVKFSNLAYSVGNEYRPLFSTSYPRKNCGRIGPKVSLEVGKFQSLLHRTKQPSTDVHRTNTHGVPMVTGDEEEKNCAKLPRAADPFGRSR